VKRLVVTLVGLVAVSVPLSGCNAFGDGVAASVNGRDITIGQVRELVEARSKDSVTPDTIDGTAGRGALAELIQLNVYRDELKRRGGEASDSDRTDAKSMVGDLKGVSAALKAELTSLYADRAALLAKLSPALHVAEPSDAEIRATAQQLIDRVPVDQRVVSCAVGVFGATSDAAAVQTLVDRGTDVGNGDAFASTGFRPIGVDGAPFCGETGEPNLDAAIKGPAGVVKRVDVATQQGDQSVFLRPTGTKTYTADDPEVLAAAKAQLEQQAQQAAQEQQTSLQAGQQLAVMKRARIDVDPRFGTFDPREIVRAPQSPVAPSAG